MKKSIIFSFIGVLILVVFISFSFFVPEEKLNFIFFKGDLRNLLITFFFILSFLPIIVENTIFLKREQEKEENFLAFVRDILEGVKSGTPITKSILNIQTRDYGALSPHIRKLANHLSLGFPLSEALNIFSKDAKNETISRTIELISEANRSGGNIVDVLSSVSESINQTQIIKKERKSSVANLLMQGYIIFIVFLIIVLILQFFLIPKLTEISKNEEISLEIKTFQTTDISRILLSIIVVESFFSGLVIGKIAEGKVRSGLKHSFILSSFSLLGFFIAKVFFG